MGCAPSSDTSSSAGSAPEHTRPKFHAIADKYETYEELQQALRKAGLESSNLVVAIDYTKSNEWSGEKSFGGKCLHSIDPSGFVVNPYQSVIYIMGHTLEAFDDDKLIPTLGFGDTRTSCVSFFNLGVNSAPCRGLAEVLDRYKQVTPFVQLSGPTNFAPVIHETIRIVQQSRQYHILVIIADGQVSNATETRNAIVAASNYPICTAFVGIVIVTWFCLVQLSSWSVSATGRGYVNEQLGHGRTRL
ncbi:hypothetical protein, variant 1 [Aphanomyces invadans]|uniref:Copine C-terminal domain-containing protein n=1 Tax=Aphanomyces invadans TaxID=157072 RepID=A0A024TIJ4_9STRA|nr:hypothetical protein, variant 1 [Aphanomyces invadans]ETV93970.1 hypothetical protein, variant 1 [Aphanomyces invadans]|eukprot:XP_008877530.1 hypothetical protein, variant 1 [Aphanomyces invadans]